MNDIISFNQYRLFENNQMVYVYFLFKNHWRKLLLCIQVLLHERWRNYDIFLSLVYILFWAQNFQNSVSIKGPEWNGQFLGDTYCDDQRNFSSEAWAKESDLFCLVAVDNLAPFVSCFVQWLSRPKLISLSTFGGFISKHIVSKHFWRNNLHIRIMGFFMW